ncbi:MAG: hypothetical protein H6918_05025 [Sphingomonadaceae bacterium]|nr:hypothetical protein [Sphingomonadaceae bacterium]
MTARTMLRPLLAALLISSLGGCGPDYDLHTVVISTTPPAGMIKPSSDVASFARITGTVWRKDMYDENDNWTGARFLFFTPDGPDWRAVLVDERGILAVPRFNPASSTQPDLPTDYLRDEDIAPNLPMKLIPAKGGVLAQMQAGKLTLFSFYALSSDGKMLQLAHRTEGKAMNTLSLGKPPLRSTDPGIYLLQQLPPSLAGAMTANPAWLYAIDTQAEPGTWPWQASQLAVPRTLNDMQSLNALKTTAMQRPGWGRP